MSNNGRPGSGDVAALADDLNPKWLLRHRFSAPQFMKQYGELAAQAAAKKLVGLRAIAPYLLEYISDEKTLFTALKHMEAEGSHAPGPDGLRYEDIARIGGWSWCRTIRDEIRDGNYALGVERLQKIPKGPGRGFRELVVQSVGERVVARAVIEVLQRLLDPLFDPRSFGFRPKKGPLRALATAERLHRNHGLGVWVSADIKNAFPSVPVGRLLGVLRKYLPDDELIEFLSTVTRPDTMPGLRQGSPLSPLLLNLHLHHFLDRVWRRLYPDIPLLRFADDILLLCRFPKQARVAYTALAKLLREAGFELKEPIEESIRKLGQGASVGWMGFSIRCTADGLGFEVADDAWDGLREAFAAAHGKPNSPIAALRSLVGWVADKAPCYPHTHFNRAYDRISHTADEQGFAEIPSSNELKGMWQRAYARWCKLQKSVASEGATAEGGK